MHIISATFEDIDEIAVSALFGALGVYVLWSPKAEKRPSYIGEGKVLSRFASEHIERFGVSAAGVVGVMQDGTASQRKQDAEIVESALFAVGADLGLSPTHNRAPGKWKGLEKLWDARHSVVRIRCSGCHPLRLGKRISGTDIIELRLEADEETFAVAAFHPWRRS